MQENHFELVKFRFWRVLKGVCLGLPFYMKYIKTPWVKISVPAFPLLFSLLATVFACLLTFLAELDHLEYDMGLEGYITHGVILTASWIWVPFTVNFLFFLWNTLLLQLFGRGVNVLRGARRITYISAFYQMLFYVGIFGVLYIGNVVWIIIACSILSIGRVAAAFECMRRETSGNIFIALMSTLGCIDIWLLIGMLFIGL